MGDTLEPRARIAQLEGALAAIRDGRAWYGLRQPALVALSALDGVRYQRFEGHEYDEVPGPGRPGYYLLNTDGGNSGDSTGRAAIGALLRTRRLAPVAQVSMVIEPATHNVAEYRALIEGLGLALDHGVRHLRVFMDSELVVDQMNGNSATRRPHLAELRKEALVLADRFDSIRVSWVPREMNAEADRLVGDALRQP
jgi:ribonuclease HI